MRKGVNSDSGDQHTKNNKAQHNNPVSKAGQSDPPSGGGGGLQGEGITRGVHIWIPHKIPSILSIQKWGRNEMLPPLRMHKKNSSTLGTKFGPNLVQTPSIFWTSWGGDVGV